MHLRYCLYLKFDASTILPVSIRSFKHWDKIQNVTTVCKVQTSIMQKLLAFYDFLQFNTFFQFCLIRNWTRSNLLTIWHIEMDTILFYQITGAFHNLSITLERTTLFLALNYITQGHKHKAIYKHFTQTFQVQDWTPKPYLHLNI